MAERETNSSETTSSSEEKQGSFRSDVVAGFATGLFSIPEGMTYAQIAGVNPVYGLYSGMVATLTAALTTGTILMINTLTSAIAIATASVIDSAGLDSSLRVQRLIRKDDGRYEEQEVPDNYPSNEATIVAISGADFFAEVPALQEALPESRETTNAVVILAIRGRQTAHSTALRWMDKYATDLRAGGNILMLSGVSDGVMDVLEHSRVIDTLGRENVFLHNPIRGASTDDALDAAAQWLQDRNSIPQVSGGGSDDSKE